MKREIANILRMPLPHRVQFLLRLARLSQQDIARASERTGAFVSRVVNGRDRGRVVEEAIINALNNAGISVTHGQIWPENAA